LQVGRAMQTPLSKLPTAELICRLYGNPLPICELDFF